MLLNCSGMPAHVVFISHSSKDDGFVRGLRHALEALGSEVWTDSERLSGGHLLSTNLRSAIQNSDCFLAVISLDALNSEWVQREIQYARDIDKPAFRLIPLMMPGIRPAALRLLFGAEVVGI